MARNDHQRVLNQRRKLFAEALIVLFCILYLWHCIACPLLLLFLIHDYIYGQLIGAQSSITIQIPSPDHAPKLFICEVIAGVQCGHELPHLGDGDEAIVILHRINQVL